MEQIGAVILAGGKSSRMGRNKAFLSIGKDTFLEHIMAQLKDFPELLISAASKNDYAGLGASVVEDIKPDCGPMGGLFSALCLCKSKWLFAVSCDVPLLSEGLIHYLLEFVSDSYDAFVLKDRNGRIHPLCAVYSRRALDVLGDCLHNGNYKLMTALKRMKVKYVPLEHSIYPDSQLANINMPEEYTALECRHSGPVVLSVCGVKNSGKTTLLERVIPYLTEKRINVAVVKHDGHDFTPDVPGTDSYRFQAVGACGTGVFSSKRAMLCYRKNDTDFWWMIRQFPKADLILVEGGKHTEFPKIEIVRSAISSAPIAGLTGRIALCTDLPRNEEDIPYFSLKEYLKIADFIENFYRSSILDGKNKY